MQDLQEPRPRARSAFAAAFLSLIFPGLGHAYARAWYRAMGFAAPPLLVLALLAGTVMSFNKFDLFGVAFDPPVLIAILIGNAVAYLYRVVAAIDAYRVVAYLNRVADGGRLGPARSRLAPASLAGLLAVIVVMGLPHVTVIQYDLIGLSAADIFNGGDNGGDSSPGPSPSPGTSGATSLSPLPSASGLPSPSGSSDASPEPSQVPWNGTDRLNILLIGADQRPAQSTFNTDTLIVVSIDPASHQVAMFSLPRDTTGVPLPPSFPARSVYGATFGGKINSLFVTARANPNQFPGGEGGYGALKRTIGYLYGIDISYYVEVNFGGFKSIIDTLGGVTINVQYPVVDDNYPGDNGPIRVYIPTGVQHMTGAQALIYARSRHGSDDFDRGARQQRVILSVRQQTDIGAIARPDVLASLVDQLKKAMTTDFPRNKLAALLTLVSGTDIGNVRSLVFAPSYYSTNDWPNSSNLILSSVNVQRIRTAVQNVFRTDPKVQAARQAITQEGAQVWVVAGRIADRGLADDLSGFLDYRGVSVSAPLIKPPAKYLANTTITVYNGAEAKMPKTIALLESTFGVTSVDKTDPSVKVDIIVTTGSRTPDRQAPAIP